MADPVVATGVGAGSGFAGACSAARSHAARPSREKAASAAQWRIIETCVPEPEKSAVSPWRLAVAPARRSARGGVRIISASTLDRIAGRAGEIVARVVDGIGICIRRRLRIGGRHAFCRQRFVDGVLIRIPFRSGRGPALQRTGAGVRSVVGPFQRPRKPVSLASQIGPLAHIHRLSRILAGTGKGWIFHEAHSYGLKENEQIGVGKVPHLQ